MSNKQSRTQRYSTHIYIKQGKARNLYIWEAENSNFGAFLLEKQLKRLVHFENKWHKLLLYNLHLHHTSVCVCICACMLCKSSALDKDLRISVVIMPPPVWDVIPLAGNKASLLPVIGQICSCTNWEGGGGGASLQLSFPDCPASSRSIHFRGWSYWSVLLSLPHINTHTHTHICF